jgi:hypothetical protein
VSRVINLTCHCRAPLRRGVDKFSNQFPTRKALKSLPPPVPPPFILCYFPKNSLSVKEKEKEKKKDMRAKDDGWMGKFETINESRRDDKHVLVLFSFFFLLRQQQNSEKYLAESNQIKFKR